MPQPGAQERTVIIEDESLRQFAGGFTSIPNRILRNGDISLGARMCYSMLLSYAWQENFCFPAQTRLAEDLGIGERTVRQYLKELRDAGLITWKQRGLNRPNVYQILKLPVLAPTAASGTPGPAESAAPDRQRASGQDRHSTSTYKDPLKNTQKVVNAVKANDRKSTTKGHRPMAGKTTPTISDRALRATYKLTDDQIGRVHWLVEKQLEVLGAGDRNHGHYVKRAAEAVRDGDGDFLDHQLGDFKQAATEIAVGSRPAYFHAMYTEALEKNRAAAPFQSVPIPELTTTPPTPQTIGNPFAERQLSNPAPEDSRSRMIADAERRGFPIPDHIRTADIRAVNRWWATLVTEPQRRN